MPRSPLVVKNGSRQRRRVSSSMPTPVSRHFDAHVRGFVAVVRDAVGDARAHGERAALRHGVDGVEDEIGERIADLAFRAHDLRQRPRPAPCCRSIDDAALLRHVAPARARQIEDLLHDAVEVDAARARSCGSRWR